MFGSKGVVEVRHLRRVLVESRWSRSEALLTMLATPLKPSACPGLDGLDVMSPATFAGSCQSSTGNQTGTVLLPNDTVALMMLVVVLLHCRYFRTPAVKCKRTTDAIWCIRTYRKVLWMLPRPWLQALSCLQQPMEFDAGIVVAIDSYCCC
jgi:hypothetical protein